MEALWRARTQRRRRTLGRALPPAPTLLYVPLRGVRRGDGFRHLGVVADRAASMPCSWRGGLSITRPFISPADIAASVALPSRPVSLVMSLRPITPTGWRSRLMTRIRSSPKWSRMPCTCSMPSSSKQKTTRGVIRSLTFKSSGSSGLATCAGRSVSVRIPTTWSPSTTGRKGAFTCFMRARASARSWSR